MITVERTQDWELVKSVFLHPEIRDEVINQDGVLPLNDNVIWMKAERDGELVGALVFIPLYGLAWNPHIAILPQYRGTGTQVMLAGIKWMFQKAQCKKILAFPFKPIMIRLYEKCGFAIEGKSSRLVMAKGEIHDCLIVGLNND